MEIVSPVIKALRGKYPEAIVEVAGSYRRNREMLKDADVLVATDNPDGISDFFATFGEKVSKGDRAVQIIRQGFVMDLRVVPLKSYGAGLLFFTGSGSFNVKCRGIAKKLSMILNQYGLFHRVNDEAGDLICQETEKEILDALDIGWVEPEARE